MLIKYANISFINNIKVKQINFHGNKTNKNNNDDKKNRNKKNNKKDESTHRFLSLDTHKENNDINIHNKKHTTLA